MKSTVDEPQKVPLSVLYAIDTPNVCDSPVVMRDNEKIQRARLWWPLFVGYRSGCVVGGNRAHLYWREQRTITVASACEARLVIALVLGTSQ